MVIDFIIDLCLVALFATFVAAFVNIVYNIKNNRSKKSSLNFIKGNGEQNLPVVTLFHNDKEYNFIVDTGSAACILDNKILNEFEYQECETQGEVYGASGDSIKTNLITAVMDKGNYNFVITFQTGEMSIFDIISQQYNLQIHGILGNTFFNQYGVTIDYNKESLVFSKYDIPCE